MSGMSSAVSVPSAAPTPAAAIAVVAQALAVTPGQSLAARVIAVQAGLVELALAGGVVTAASDLPLEAGQTLRLVVESTTPDRVTLRIAPEQPPGGGAPAAAGPAAAIAEAGVPASAASALLATMAEQGEPLPRGTAATALATRAAAAEVATPAQAAAFVRLATAGLPTTPATVTGLAELIEGPPLGRALTTLIDAATARVAAGTAPVAESPESPAATSTALAAPARAALAASASPPPVPGSSAGATPAPSPAPGGGVPSGTPVMVQVEQGRSPQGGPTPAPTPPATPGLGPLLDSLARLIHDIEGGSVDGRPEALRRAVAELGSGLEHRLAGGSVPDEPPLRSLLFALAGHPGADPSLARAAASVADGLSAQTLAGAVLPGGGAAAEPSTQAGAYLQLPLPGGGTAEVRISPDAGGEGGPSGGRPRRLAFLLHLSALGPVMIEASAGSGGVDATVRVGSDEARAFLSDRAGELAEGLRRSAPAASVSVGRMSGPPPERLLAPPPSSGVDARA